MTNYDLYRISTRRHPVGDPLRALLLILATVLAGIVFTAAVPDDVKRELSAQSEAGMWHGNVASYRIHE